MSCRALIIVMALAGCATPSTQGAVVDSKAAEAMTVFKTHCYACHGEKFEVDGLNVLDIDGMLQPRTNDLPYVTAGNSKKSAIYQRMSRGDMPPASVEKRPTQEEIKIVAEWIAAGAERPRNAAAPRNPLDEMAIMKLIFNDLIVMNTADQHFQRYFSLANWHNNPLVTDYDMQLYRAGFVKLLNSLSQNSRLIQPVLIDAPADNKWNGAIFRIDLRDFRWDYKTWRQAVATYPYGLDFSAPTLNDQQRKIYNIQGGAECADGVPYIRADWFTARASRGTIYNTLLNLPKTEAELMKQLGVNFERDFKQGSLCRVGFTQSGVSYGNRLVDRMEASGTQYYYKSYDFKATVERQMVLRFPLGPSFTGNEHNDQAFAHDGGEVIWSLANGMQGYLITDTVGNRIDEAPVSIVRDLTEIAGTPAVVNGISCMGCHKSGIKPLTDQVRTSFLLNGEARTMVQRLFPEQSKVSELIESDSDRFQEAVYKLIHSYFGPNADRDTIANIEEPITRLARIYDRDMDITEVAMELGKEEAELIAMIKGSQALQNMGLGVLAEKGYIPRGMWDSTGSASASIFQRTARAIGIGIPTSP